MIRVLAGCQRELDKFPDDVLRELLEVFTVLEAGKKLSMPLSRPMPSIGSGVYEIRLRDRSGIYRVIYIVQTAGNIWMIHGFKKTTQETPKQNIELAKRRMKEILR